MISLSLLVGIRTRAHQCYNFTGKYLAASFITTHHQPKLWFSAKTLFYWRVSCSILKSEKYLDVEDREVDSTWRYKAFWWALQGWKEVQPLQMKYCLPLQPEFFRRFKKTVGKEAVLNVGYMSYIRGGLKNKQNKTQPW